MAVLTVDPHPLLDHRAFLTTFPTPLGQCPSGVDLLGRLDLESDAPLAPSDAVKTAVRDLLRHGGFKPAGRNKPASEYLIKAVAAGKLSAINLAVDACNVASLHGGLPISVVDTGRAAGPFRLGIADPGTGYIFNASGQQIDISGLLCLFDSHGPCANSVKDSQRTKTHDGTTHTLSVVWGTSALPGRTQRLTAWYRSLLEANGATTQSV